MIFKPNTRLVINKDLMDAPNLTDRFKGSQGEQDLQRIGGMVVDGYDRDLRSRSLWEKRMNAGMDLAMQVAKEKNFPWPNSANVIFPLVTIAALQFSARSYSNIIQGTDVVKYRVVGDDKDGKLTDKALRIGRHMSWQALEEDTAWEEEHDRLLINLAIVGTAFIKTSHDASKRHNVSELVTARDFVLDYHAKAVDSCARKTQVIPLYQNEVYERVMQQVFRDVRKEDWFNTTPTIQPTNKSESDARTGMSEASDEADYRPYQTLEQHRYFDFDGDGYAEPYVVTVEKSSRKVLRIVARFEGDNQIDRNASKEIICIRPTEYYTKYSLIPSPDGGIYDIGFGALLGPLNEAVNTGINQLLDSGTMQNSLGGFLGRGAKIRDGVYTMSPWEWKRVDSSGDDLRKNLVQLPDRQPSAVMFNLLGFIVQYVDRLAGTTDAQVGENPGQNTPAYNMKEMLSQGSQVYNTVFKRVWRAMKEEFKKRHKLNGMFLTPEMSFGQNGKFKIRREDYVSNPDLVVPVADPNVTSDAQRVQLAGALAERSQVVDGYDREYVERNLLRAMRVENPELFFPGPGKVPPLPNPKSDVEQMKLKAKQMDHQHEKQLLIMQLMADRELNDAKIMELRAKAASELSAMGNERSALQLEAFDSAIDAYMRHQELLQARIDSLKEGDEGGNGGSVEGMAPGPSNPGVPPGPLGMANGSGQAMDGGGLSE